MSKKNFNLGKYSKLCGTTVKREVSAAAPVKGIVSKAGGKTCNYPLDSDAEFEKRMKLRYKRMQAEAEAEAEAVSSPSTQSTEDASAAVSA